MRHLTILSMIFFLLHYYHTYSIVANVETHNKKQSVKEKRKIVHYLIESVDENKVITKSGKIIKIKNNIPIIKNFKQKPKIVEIQYKNGKVIFIILK